MDQTTANELVAGGQGTLKLGERLFFVSAPSDADMATLTGELRRRAKSKAVNPLAAVAEEYESLPPALREAAVKAAVAQGKKEHVEPTTDQIAAQIYDPESLRFWVWWLARKHDATLTLESFTPLITDANVLEVLMLLGEATKVNRIGPNSNGRTSSPTG